MKIAIIQFPGSNCESESIRAVHEAGMEPVEFLWNQNPNELKNFDGFFIVGGFSYEDRSRSGIIASLDPIMKYIKAENEKGKPILGICNGAQVLVETGIVPGLKEYAVGMALAVNKRIQNEHVLGTGFYNTWVNIQLSAPSNSCAFSQSLEPGEFIHVPIAHGEGRFTMPVELLEELKRNNQTVFRYCDDAGQISEEFPVNPNGAMYNLAAVCNSTGNAMAMMPHPERTSVGQPIFTSMRGYIAEKKEMNIQPISCSPTPIKIENYQPTNNSTEWLVKLIITDNEAVTVRNALKHIGVDVDIKKYSHWEIIPEKNTTINFDEIKKSGELFNSNKEFIANDKDNFSNTLRKDSTINILVRYRDDFVGKSKLDTLNNRFDIKNIKEIKKGIIWQIAIKSDNINDVKQQILDSKILFNQYSQIGYFYQLSS
ncbi:MAG: phosphoribosylformylglycinamidine synthase I [Candidatus Magasanikbacteria bacterium]